MIALQKEQEPQILAANHEKWTLALVAHNAAGTKPTETELSHYNHPSIKAALVAETSAKCAYCESKFLHVTYGDIEHIVPKKNDVHLRFKWSNLTLACDVCNTNKGDKEGIIDPYLVDPGDLLVFTGPVVLARPECSEAIITELALKLNRAALVERRAERIKRLHDIVLLAKQNSNPIISQAIIADLRENETKNSVEFAAASRSYITSMEASGVL